MQNLVFIQYYCKFAMWLTFIILFSASSSSQLISPRDSEPEPMDTSSKTVAASASRTSRAPSTSSEGRTQTDKDSQRGREDKRSRDNGGDEEVVYTCNYCAFPCADQDSLFCHKANLHSRAMMTYDCVRSCGFATVDEDHYNRHIRNCDDHRQMTKRSGRDSEDHRRPSDRRGRDSEDYRRPSDRRGHEKTSSSRYHSKSGGRHR